MGVNHVLETPKGLQGKGKESNIYSGAPITGQEISMLDSFNPPTNFMKSSHYPVLEIRKMRLCEVKKLTEVPYRQRTL